MGWKYNENFFKKHERMQKDREWPVMPCLVWRHREGPMRQKQRRSDGSTSWKTLRISSSHTDLGKDQQLSLRTPQRNQPHEPLNLGLLDTWPKRKLLFAVLKPPCLCLFAIEALNDGLGDWKPWRRWHQQEVWAGAKTPWLALWLAEHMSVCSRRWEHEEDKSNREKDWVQSLLLKPLRDLRDSLWWRLRTLRADAVLWSPNLSSQRDESFIQERIQEHG